MPMTIEFRPPVEELAEDAAPDRLEADITAELNALTSQFTKAKVKGPTHSGPPPGTAGISEAVTWVVSVVSDPAFIDAAKTVLAGISIAIQTYKLLPKGKKKKSEQRNVVVVKIENKTLVLPASSNDIDKFLKSVK